MTEENGALEMCTNKKQASVHVTKGKLEKTASITLPAKMIRKPRGREQKLGFAKALPRFQCGGLFCLKD